ncbi:carbohydrate ABC transporter permease [Nesterenkonia xinjiangensis]|uniref:Multiple sugar transport system permease protein n=1 Tax=Nesterenkonia xinjiangensis TaxID=225327 RepID=A0A7Z0K990_9MICC|nr:carbohydrate ABC transporter permease [Nesterenkonia xinjiangensis]NYJ76970.1 multiple sugar transport system permease protein [Nesterenkonia xinjiangensis]
MSTTITDPLRSGQEAPAERSSSGAGGSAPMTTRPRRPFLLGRPVVYLVLGVFVIYTLAPVAWLFFAAASDADALSSAQVFSLREFALFDNIRELFATDGGLYARWYLNTILYAALGGILASLISVAAGYAFDKYDYRHKEKLFGLVLLAVMVPQTVLALPLYLIASEIGLVNTFWAVFIPVLFNPFGVYLGRIFSEGYIPDEVLDAARMDGSGEVKMFFTVALKMLAPGVMTVFLFQLTAIWNNFFLPMVMLSDQELYPVALGLYNWNSMATVSPEYQLVVITGSLLGLLPLILAFMLLQRFWKAGLTAGSVK